MVIKSKIGANPLFGGGGAPWVIAVTTNSVNNLSAALLAGVAVQATHVHNKITGAILLGVDFDLNLSVNAS